MPRRLFTLTHGIQIIFFNILSNFLVQTLIYFQKKIKSIFRPWKHEKTKLKVAHNS